MLMLINLQPNPTQNQLNVYTNFIVNANTQLQVVNILEEIVIAQTMFNKQQNYINLNVEHLTLVTYFVIVVLLRI